MTTADSIPDRRTRAARRQQRPWRAARPQSRPAVRAIEHRFAAPLVRELPPRREARAAAGTW